MMEEVSDDTNGDSTFEFLGDAPATTAAATPSTPVTPSPQIIQPASTLSDTGPSVLPPPLPMPSFIDASPQGSVPPPPPPPPTTYQPPIQQTSTTSSPSAGPICSAPQPFYMPPSAPPSATVDLSMADPYHSAPLLQQQRSDSSGVWGWFRGSDLLNKVAEKAKSSMDSMITTLDPGMKEYIYSGGNVDVVVASYDEDQEVSPVREAFQATFGRATVSGIPSQPQSVAVQPVGFPAALQGAEERISYLRQGGHVHQQQAVLAIQNFLVELTPDRWFEMTCLLLQDPMNSTTLQTYTQPLAIPVESVMQAQEQTPSDYPLRWSGLAVPVGRSPDGICSRDLVLMASRALANMYKHRLQQQFI